MPVEIDRQKRRLDKLATERKKLLQLHYADQIPAELFAEEQERIASDERAAQALISSLDQRTDKFLPFIQRTFQILRVSADGYLNGSPDVRRVINQILFERVWITERGVAIDHKRSELFTDLVGDAIEQRLQAEVDKLTSNQAGNEDSPADGEAADPEIPVVGVGSCNKNYLVGAARPFLNPGFTERIQKAWRASSI